MAMVFPTKREDELTSESELHSDDAMDRRRRTRNASNQVIRSFLLTVASCARIVFFFFFGALSFLERFGRVLSQRVQREEVWLNHIWSFNVKLQWILNRALSRVSVRENGEDKRVNMVKK